MCRYWVPPSLFPFLHQFRGIQTYQRYKTFLHFQQPKKKGKKHKKKKEKKKKRKDNPNQLLINEINALQTEQSN